MKALIIAAGRGGRLLRENHEPPKPLTKVAGLSLIERGILSAKQAGITEFVIVIGFRGDEIRKALSSKQKKWGVTFQFIENPNWEKSNGHSVLKAKSALQEDFLLMMSDHVFDWRVLPRLFSQEPQKGIILAVDRRINQVFDLEDATKVQTNGDRIVQIGKEIPKFNAVDTGLFYCSPKIFEALEIACKTGSGSLTEGVRQLSEAGKGKVFDIGDSYWQDVDTPATLSEAERILLQATRKPATDGVVSSRLNRKISGWISKRLVRLPITPNQITLSALIIGLLSSLFVAQGTPIAVALGGVLFQFASIYDGCDGEVAKLKMCGSKLGEWLDTICDNVTYLAFITGAMIGAIRQGTSSALILGLFGLTGFLISFAVMSSYILRFTDSGSLVSFQKELIKNLGPSGFWAKLISGMKHLVKRDFFALFFMVLCLINRLDLILFLTALGGHLTWLLLVVLRREPSPRPDPLRIHKDAIESV